MVSHIRWAFSGVPHQVGLQWCPTSGGPSGDAGAPSAVSGGPGDGEAPSAVSFCGVWCLVGLYVVVLLRCLVSGGAVCGGPSAVSGDGGAPSAVCGGPSAVSGVCDGGAPSAVSGGPGDGGAPSAVSFCGVW